MASALPADGHGTIHQFPRRNPTGKADVNAASQAPGTMLQEMLDNSAPGDCVYLAPGTYKLTEPLAIRHDLFMLGFDDADGRKVVLDFDGGRLVPALPLLRVEDNAKVVISTIQFAYSHDVDNADPVKAAQTHAIRVFSGALELRSCTVISTVSGVDVREGATFTGVSTDLSVACVGVEASGRAHLHRGTVAGCAVGLRAATEPSNVSSDEALFVSCGAGVVVEELAEAMVRNTHMKECKVGVAVRSHSTRADPVSVIGSTFRECGRGVFIQGQCCNPTVAKCTFEHCTASGVCIDSGSPQLTGCAVTNTPIGIEVLAGEATITECAVEEFSDVGILVSGPATMPRIVKCLIRADATGQRERATEVVVGAVAQSLMAGAAALLDDAAVTALPPTVPTIGIAIEETSAPHVEDTTFDNNDINICGLGACGVVEANLLGVTEFDNVVYVGATSDVVIQENDIMGTRRGTGVGVYSGARATVRRNKLDSVQLAGVTLRSCGETTVTENEITACQDAVVVMGSSVGKSHRNQTDLATVVFTDAAATFTAATR